ncbi:MAG: hypothetical protein GWN07_02405, partial [Actinobacteria bacterium]|nr:hypothetical protein [Actinomycetota bacterium]NIU64366.1 hypothetical protein [Actinomycetota bacterium]NIV85670.1 hypothetical protein [Actinomycetota bacterium]NIW26176.1 hypothetical protein [Actinomycetota bacterium]NIX18749.1 hypothetical protein [Actinomycetota bacterium]
TPTTSTTKTTTSTPATGTATTTTLAPRPEIPAPPASTVTELLELDEPLVIGHAGGDQSWPHSTMFAFHQAAAAGTDVLEMDVQLTKDGVLVVQHDDTVDRTTESTGRVRDLNLVEIQALDNAYWWSREWSSHDLPDEEYVHRGIRTGEVEPPPGYTPEDFKVETFRAVAEAFPDHVLDVEIKVPRGDDGNADLDFAIGAARALAMEIADLGRTDSVIVVSFDDEVTDAFREFAPDVTTSPGTDATLNWFLGSGELHPNDRLLQLPPEFDGVIVLNPILLEKAEADGLDIWVWPNSRSQENADFYVEMIDVGAEGIIAGRPADAVERFRADGLIS